ncbi:Na(+)/H(+) exchange regulatory cofactor NHE-RF2 [Clonorchis sinensis]|uniref:Na(+)/H(+) exchange regulatory cofactor NHE-RF2 n=1 Tax=Clonorchis sinensis TaxID=79923 RepID=G7YMS7_CLOSI|nr:Na(+)/H(+) exchange regulatory cofactor NHE-RF2 [Clonorchis sinensis]
MESVPHARLCELQKWNDFTGYGFSLKGVKGRVGNSICEVDPDSPAYAGGIRNGDLVVEVNGINVRVCLPSPHKGYKWEGDTFDRQTPQKSLKIKKTDQRGASEGLDLRSIKVHADTTNAYRLPHRPALILIGPHNHIAQIRLFTELQSGLQDECNSQTVDTTSYCVSITG